MNEDALVGDPIDEVPRRDPTEERCMGKKKQKRDGEVVRTDDGTPVFGGYCRSWPGKGTDHVGDGRCKLHAGASPTGEANPAFKHGLFSDHLGPEDRETIAALEDVENAAKLEDLINWRLARLRRYLRQMDADEERSFWDALQAILDQTGEVERAELKELGKMLGNHERALQEEIDLVRKLIKAHDKVAGDGEGVGSLRDLFGGGDSE
jgi:hypothetical protein